jgi:hypothetical protein
MNTHHCMNSSRFCILSPWEWIMTEKISLLAIRAQDFIMLIQAERTYNDQLRSNHSCLMDREEC